MHRSSVNVAGSAGFNFAYTGAYAGAPAGTTGAYAYFTDWGENGTMARWNGTRWRPVQGGMNLATLAAPVSGITNVENMVLQTLMPINSAQARDVVLVRFGVAKSGNTNTGQITIRIGPTGTTADTAITGISALQIMGSTGLSGGGTMGIVLQSATSAKKVGANPAQNAASYTATSATTAEAAPTAITSTVTTALYVSVGFSSGGSADTLSVHDCQIQLTTP